MKNNQKCLALTLAYFFLVSGLISLFSVIVTMLISSMMGFSPLQHDGLGNLVIMSFIPFGWTIISFATFGFLLYYSKYIKNKR